MKVKSTMMYVCVLQLMSDSNGSGNSSVRRFEFMQAFVIRLSCTRDWL